MFFRTANTIDEPLFILRNRLFVPLLLSQLALGWDFPGIYDQKRESTVAQPASIIGKRIGVSVHDLPAGTVRIQASESINLPAIASLFVLSSDPTVKLSAFQVPDMHEKRMLKGCLLTDVERLWRVAIEKFYQFMH